MHKLACQADSLSNRLPNRSSEGHVSTMKDNQIKCKCGLSESFFCGWCLMPCGALSVVRGRAAHNEGSRLRGPFKHVEWNPFLGDKIVELLQDKGEV